jgi:hypothetical protein
MNQLSRVCLGLFLLLTAGCTMAPIQASRTEASLQLPDGREFTYYSNKEQTGIDVSITEIDPKTNRVIKKWRLKVAKTGTPEAAYAAMVQQQTAMTKQNEAVTDLVRGVLEKLGAAAPVPGQ